MRGIFGLILLFSAALVLFQSCGGFQRESALARPGGPQFNHALHGELGVECGDCHGAEDEGFMAMPTHETCWDCHGEIEEEAPPEKKIAPFFDAEQKPKWTKVVVLVDEVIFDHPSHVAKAEGDCLACHRVIAESKAVPANAGITMDDCIACHEQKAPTFLECAACHKEQRIDRPPGSHRLGWRQAHGRQAAMGAFETLPKNCSYCHDRSSCDECHRAEMPRSHNNLWRLHGHAAMASLDRERCEVCHTTDSCVQCHRMSAPRSHRGAWGAPFDRHCLNCHIPLGQPSEQGCAVCHRAAPHSTAPTRPPTLVHQTTDPNVCRTCHQPPPHVDNGQSCLLCHR